MSKEKKPYICCCGKERGTAVIFGYSADEPRAQSVVRLENARMVLYWPSGGLLGLANRGPADKSRITARVAVTEAFCHEWVAVNDAAAKAIEQWPEA